MLVAGGGANWVGLYTKRSPGSCCDTEDEESWGGAAGDETKSVGADGSTGAGDGTKNCGVEEGPVAAGVVAGNSGSSNTGGRGLLTELILMLDGLT